MSKDNFLWDMKLRLGPETRALSRLTWPNFLVEESDIPNATLQFKISPEELSRRLPAWGIRREKDHSLVAFANAAAIFLEPGATQLPSDGWQYAMSAFSRAEEPNCLCLLNISVNPDFQRFGFSRMLLEQAKRVATLGFGFRWLAGPVRPSRKCEFPRMPLADYLQMKNEQGERFDPWLRTHEKLGAEVLNICVDSVVVRASITRWNEWCGNDWKSPGKYDHPSALVPIEFADGIGLYREPNVWVRYQLEHDNSPAS